MKKKAQITIFIIIALVILVSGLIYMGLSRKGIKNQKDIIIENKDVYNFVKTCSENSLKKIVYLIGIRGGYMFEPENSNDFGLPYYYINGKNTIITKQDLKKKIEFYFNYELNSCLNNFKDFPNKKISSGEINSEIEIKDEKLVLNLEYPLSISQGNKTSLIENFDDIEVPIRLGKIYNLSNEIINNDIKGDELCLSCIYKKALKENLFIDVFEYNKDYIFSIKDNSTQLNKTFIYDFAIRI